MAEASRRGSRNSTLATKTEWRSVSEVSESPPLFSDEPTRDAQTAAWWSLAKFNGLREFAPDIAAVMDRIDQVSIRARLLLMVDVLAASVAKSTRGFSDTKKALARLIEQQNQDLREIGELLEKLDLGPATGAFSQDYIPAMVEKSPSSGGPIETLDRHFDEQIGEGRLIDADFQAALAAFVARHPEWATRRRTLVVQNVELGLKAAEDDTTVVPARAVSPIEPKRPKWPDKEKPAELRGLTSPQFLKAVHADIIKDNIVRKLDVRARDPELMEAVENYISKRKKRGANLGDAAGLIFIISHPTRNRVRREVTYRRKFGTAPADFIEGLRETGRKSTKSRRERRRHLAP